MTNVRTRSSVASCLLLVALSIPVPAQGGGLLFSGDVLFDDDGVVDGLRNGRGVVVSPDDRHVYVASEGDDAVAVFCFSPFCPVPPAGLLGFVEAQLDGVGGVDGLRGAHAVAVSADGLHVYVAAEADDAVAVFARNATTGALTFVEAQIDGVGGVDGLNFAEDVVLSPGGEHVYVAAMVDDAVAVFDRNAGTGALTFVEAERDGVGGADGLDGARALAMSADGKHLYVVAADEDAIAVFARDALTGALTFVEAEREDVGGVSGLGQPIDVAVTPDGGHVYASSAGGDALVTFARNATTGTLTFTGAARDVVGVGTLGGQAVLASPDSRYVYLANTGNNAVITFARDVVSGRLTVADAQREGVNGVDGVAAPRGLAVAFGGSLLYLVSGDRTPPLFSTGAITAFAVDACPSGTTTGEEQCDDGNTMAGDGCDADCRLEICGSAPVAGCRQPTLPGKSSLAIVDATNDTRDKLGWRWGKGAATDASTLGTPLATTAYVLCLYDGSAAPQPLLSLAAPPAGTCAGLPCWSADPTSVTYKDKLLTPDGLVRVGVKAGVAGRARAVARARGTVLRIPPLPLTPPVTVQLRRADAPAECWEAEFSGVITQNDAAGFEALSD